MKVVFCYFLFVVVPSVQSTIFADVLLLDRLYIAGARFPTLRNSCRLAIGQAERMFDRVGRLRERELVPVSDPGSTNWHHRALSGAGICCCRAYLNA